MKSFVDFHFVSLYGFREQRKKDKIKVIGRNENEIGLYWDDGKDRKWERAEDWEEIFKMDPWRVRDMNSATCAIDRRDIIWRILLWPVGSIARWIRLISTTGQREIFGKGRSDSGIRVGLAESTSRAENAKIPDAIAIDFWKEITRLCASRQKRERTAKTKFKAFDYLTIKGGQFYQEI